MRSKNSSYNQILNLWGHLESSQRFKLFTLCLLILFSGFLEILTIGSVVPFMMAIVDSESLFSNPNLSKILDFFEIETCLLFVRLTKKALLLLYLFLKNSDLSFLTALRYFLRLQGLSVQKACRIR